MSENYDNTGRVRRGLATPEMSQWLNTVRGDMISMGSFDWLRKRYPAGHILYLRLTHSEREMLEMVLADENGGDSPPPASPVQPSMLLHWEITVLLFMRW
jgi:hypothetical protein